ncbi:MAG: hypothetical protein OEV73_00250 [Desulfobulbaceae bacterium]|nr:hypothetical protein [Desulfobulbaceae bacterium]
MATTDASIQIELDRLEANEFERRAAAVLLRMRGQRRAMGFIRDIEKQRSGKGQMSLFNQGGDSGNKAF